MLLRRITKHLEEQNWFAVGIDMLVVIFGIFIGFQLNSWNVDRQNLIKGKNYLHRITQELEQDVGFFDGVINRNRQNIENALFLLETIEDEELVREDPKRFITSLTSIGVTLTVNISDNTFEEIKYSGNLELIADEELRNKIADYYDFIEMERNYSHLRNFAETEYFRRNTGVASIDWTLNGTTAADREYTEVDALIVYQRFLQNQDLIDWIPAVILTKRSTIGFSTVAQRRAQDLIKLMNGEEIIRMEER